MSIRREEVLSDVWRDGIFEGKVVFCTGGGGSLVSIQARALVILGANACIVGRNVENTERVARDIATARKGAKVLGLGAVDVRSLESLESAVATCVKELGQIDFVIAGAAGNFLAPLTQLSQNAFKSVIDIDLFGSWNTLKATLPHLVTSAQKNKSDGKRSSKSGTGGRIIFISATLGYTGMPLQTHAVVAKAGVDKLAVQAAIELGPRGITSNVIAPGAVVGTEGTNRLIKNGSDTNVIKSVPSGRLGTVKDMADVVVYLFSDAGSYVNGETIVVDGGAWHTHGAEAGSDFAYPDFLLSDEVVSGVKGTRKSKM